MKIIRKDNFNRDTESDKLVCENINNSYGKRLVDYMNNQMAGFDIFYELVEDDYKLYKWEP
jgi:hypothetical protein